jgi:hypothetical protein
MDPVAVYVLRCVQNGSESLGLKAPEDFVAGIGGCPHSLTWIISIYEVQNTSKRNQGTSLGNDNRNSHCPYRNIPQNETGGCFHEAAAIYNKSGLGS